jgi:hypothetical protein
MDLYANLWALVNQIDGFGYWGYVKISQISNDFSYVDDIPVSLKIQISLLVVVNSSKS